METNSSQKRKAECTFDEEDDDDEDEFPFDQEEEEEDLDPFLHQDEVKRQARVEMVRQLISEVGDLYDLEDIRKIINQQDATIQNEFRLRDIAQGEAYQLTVQDFLLLRYPNIQKLVIKIPYECLEGVKTRRMDWLRLLGIKFVPHFFGWCHDPRCRNGVDAFLYTPPEVDPLTCSEADYPFLVGFAGIEHSNPALVCWYQTTGPSPLQDFFRRCGFHMEEEKNEKQHRAEEDADAMTEALTFSLGCDAEYSQELVHSAQRDRAERRRVSSTKPKMGVYQVLTDPTTQRKYWKARELTNPFLVTYDSREGCKFHWFRVRERQESD